MFLYLFSVGEEKRRRCHLNNVIVMVIVVLTFPEFHEAQMVLSRCRVARPLI